MDNYRTILKLQVILVLLFLMQATAVAAPPLTDQEITDAVEDGLQHDPAMPPAGIDVATEQGLVTLSGEVDNILAKDRATRIAETVKGVTGVKNTISVRPDEKVPDQELARRVRDALLFNPATDSYDTDVSVNNGVVMMSGRVQSFQEKQFAETVVKGIKGVSAVVNNIDIVYKTRRPDPEIKADVEQGLKWDVLLNSGYIRVQVNDGVVRLSGMVASAAEKTRARGNAWVAGVQSVDASGVKVGGWDERGKLAGDKLAGKSDADLRKAVERVLRIDPLVHAFAVDTEVKDGVVTLRGTVDNLQTKRAAAADAMTVAGVAWVNNRIKVAPASGTTDAQIFKRASDSLSLDPFLDRSEIRIEVRNGMVTLSGSADTYFDKLRAERIVSSLNGVAAVDNNLRVENVSSITAADPYRYDEYAYEEGWSGRNGSSTRPGKSDRQIMLDTKKELERSPFVDAGRVTVSVDAGIATLTGTVDSWVEAQIAADKAFQAGAAEVVNALRVARG